MGSLLLAALRGDDPRSSTYIEAGIDLANSRGEGTAAQVGYWAAPSTRMVWPGTEGPLTHSGERRAQTVHLDALGAPRVDRGRRPDRQRALSALTPSGGLVRTPAIARATGARASMPAARRCSPTTNQPKNTIARL